MRRRPFLVEPVAARSFTASMCRSIGECRNRASTINIFYPLIGSDLSQIVPKIGTLRLTAAQTIIFPRPYRTCPDKGKIVDER